MGACRSPTTAAQPATLIGTAGAAEIADRPNPCVHEHGAIARAIGSQTEKCCSRCLAGLREGSRLLGPAIPPFTNLPRSRMGFWLGTLFFLLIQAAVTLSINALGQPGNKGCAVGECPAATRPPLSGAGSQCSTDPQADAYHGHDSSGAAMAHVSAGGGGRLVSSPLACRCLLAVPGVVVARHLACDAHYSCTAPALACQARDRPRPDPSHPSFPAILHCLPPTCPARCPQMGGRLPLAAEPADQPGVQGLGRLDASASASQQHAACCNQRS